MPTLKAILNRQAAIPANFEKSIPGLPKMSQVMTQIAAALPVDPMLPEVPVGAEAITRPPVTGFTQVIKGVEDVLPEGVPKISESIQLLATGGYRPIEEKKEAAKPARRVMGGGYRSIS